MSRHPHRRLKSYKAVIVSDSGTGRLGNRSRPKQTYFTARLQSLLTARLQCLDMILFCLIVNKQGCIRLKRNYQHDSHTNGQQQREREVITRCLARNKKQCKFFYHENMTIVYKTFTALCLIAGITKDENELAIQEVMNVFMESLVLYFGQVSELDIVFNMERVYMILDEVIINGSVGFTSKERALLPLQLLDAGS